MSILLPVFAVAVASYPANTAYSYHGCLPGSAGAPLQCEHFQRLLPPQLARRHGPRYALRCVPPRMKPPGFILKRCLIPPFPTTRVQLLAFSPGAHQVLALSSDYCRKNRVAWACV